MASRLAKISENVRELDAKELAFVDAYSTPPYKSVARAGELAGYSPTYAYKLVVQPHIKAAIAERTNQIRESNDSRYMRLMAKWGDGALDGDVHDSKLFLQGLNVGQGGVRIVNNVTATAGQTEPLEERIRGRFERVKAEVSNDS